MNTRTLGATGPSVSAVGLGCMAMSGMYGPADEHEAIATIHSALDAGINLLDTGDFYGMGHNEMLIARVLEEHNRDEVVISVKFGGMRGPDNAVLGYDARPAAVKNFCAYSLKRNLELIDSLRKIADATGATVAQLAIAWVASRGDDIFPLIGARRREQLAEALGAVELELTRDQLAQIEAAVPAEAAAGARYPDAQMAVLDSER